MRVLLFVAVLLLSSCGRSAPESSSWNKPDSIVVGCEDYQSLEIKHGVLYNNVWNKHADESGDGVQCLESREVDGSIQYGWSWSWPEGKRVIYAYPQIKVGSSPWDPEPRFDERFPKRISSLQRFELDFDVETVTNGDHNLAASVWLTTEPIKGGEPNPSVIAAEIMIWSYSTEGHFDPAGTKTAEIEIDGDWWEVWVDRDWKDASGMNDNRWTYVTYRSKEQSMSTTLRLLKLLEYAVEHQIVSENLYVSDLELGNEIMSGSGITWINSFEVVLD
ncbi:hypothetical protein [Marinimicrobium sp. ABcell2]|uniref:GH12 family glycosyl hydrolase domain-containing protein n=1 Tax=Marinimicrobium sp. ABcell2 TaxID=3069751 RepID=UPI0027B4BA86|nr:hypothetical protein [Marinimicrobium sp. ABcell2]MDQ2076266.1 hypothetical protein [Marinimicrobium sp. ABcell2]